MKRTVKPLYGIKGYPNQARFDEFKTDLFEEDVPVPILVDEINEGTTDAGVTVEGVLLKDGTITTTAPLIYSVDPAVTAHAGGTKAAAFPVTEEINIITVCASDGDSILLPAAVVGLDIKVVNLSENLLYVYGAGTNTIDDILTANPFIMQAEDKVVFSCYTTAKWQSDSEADGVYSTLYVDTVAENTSGTGVTIDGVKLIDGGALIITGGTNTFNLANGSASLDVIAGATVDINDDFTITAGFGITLAAQDAVSTITLDYQTFEVEGEGTATRLLKLVNLADAAATLSISGTAGAINQDVQSSASPGFIGVTLTPAADTSPITITGTNVATGHIIDVNATALTTGSILDYTGITTKIGDYLFNGSMTTSVLTKTTIIDDFGNSCAHDGLATDTLRIMRRIWSGAIPNGTAVADFVFCEYQWSSIYGSGSDKGGNPRILLLDSNATINDSAANFYALDVDLSGMTFTSVANVYGINITGKTGVDAGINLTTPGTTGIIIGASTTGISLTGARTTGISMAGALTYIPLQVGTKENTSGSGVVLTGVTDNSGGVQLYFDDGGVSVAGEVVAPIRSRMLITVAQTSGTSVCGSFSQLVTLGTTGATKALTTGALRAAYIFNQVGALTMTSAAEVAGINQAITVAGNTTVDTTSTFVGVDINIRGTGSVTPAGNGVVSGLYIRSSETPKWTTAIKIANAAATTGINIGSCTTGITLGDIPTGISFTNAGATGEHLIDVVDAYTGLVIETGTYSSSASQGITINATNNRPVSFLFDDAGIELTTNCNVTPVLSRTAFTIDSTASQVRFANIRGHIKCADTIDLGGDASEYFAVQGLIECAGTTTIGAGAFAAGVCGMLWADGTFTGTGLAAGVMAKLYQTAGVTTATSAFAATKWWNSADTWSYGLYIEDATVDAGHDIRLQGGATIGSGTASPNGTIDAIQGSMYLQTGAAHNATIWINTAGGTTWVVCDSVKA